MPPGAMTPAALASELATGMLRAVPGATNFHPSTFPFFRNSGTCYSPLI